jgi:PhzF family phenazine biosynthesis protein
MRKPETVMQLPKDTILKTVDLSEDDIITDEHGLVDVISTGLKDIILEVRGIEILKKMKIRKDRMIEVCKEFSLIGMHVVSRETIDKDSDFCCRNFAPAVGIDEESATGTSNASLLYYIIKNNKNFNFNKIYKVEQGYFMNSPSNIYLMADKLTGSIFVGGKAKIDNMEEIQL